MDWTGLTGSLALVTLIGVVALAFWSKRSVQNRIDDTTARTSTLAKDQSSKAILANV